MRLTWSLSVEVEAFEILQLDPQPRDSDAHDDLHSLGQFVREANYQSGKAITAAYAALLVNWGNDLIARTP
jgi:hypothetical protein